MFKSEEDLFTAGCAFMSGIGVELDPVEGFKCFKKAADKGHIQAQFEVGCCYDTGTGVKQDLIIANHYYHQAADSLPGHAQAQYNLAANYAEGRGCHKKNPELAFYYFKLAADADPEFNDAQYQVGFRYRIGLGVPQNGIKAIEYLTRAADNGMLMAQLRLECIYDEGIMIPRDAAKATHYRKLAADQGHEKSQYIIANQFLYGIDLPQNPDKAFYYYQKAANQGNVDALYKLACCYEKGVGVLQNDAEALKNFEKAAQSDYYAHRLALRYQFGRGVPKNKELARFYHQKATTLSEKNLPPELIKKMKWETIVSTMPSLPLKVLEKSVADDKVTEKSLADYVLSPEVDLGKSCILLTPPAAQRQRGQTCAFYSVAIGLEAAYPDRAVPARKNPIKSVTKEQVDTHPVSLRQKAKQYGSKIGEVFDVTLLEKITHDFGFDECKTFQTDSSHYVETIRTTIQAGHYVVLPIDQDNNFPGTCGGKGAHYALAWGVIYKNDEYYFLVTQRDYHYLWSAEAIRASHEKMPDEIPAREYYKNRSIDSYSPVEDEQKIPERDLRKIPAASLMHFKWSGFTIPCGEKNYLKVQTQGSTQSFYSETRNSSTYSLRFLFRMNTAIKRTDPENNLAYEKQSKASPTKSDKNRYSQ